MYASVCLCAHAYMHIRGRWTHTVAMVTSTTRVQEAEATGSQGANQRSDTHHAILRPINVFRASKDRVGFQHLDFTLHSGTLHYCLTVYFTFYRWVSPIVPSTLSLTLVT